MESSAQSRHLFSLSFSVTQVCLEVALCGRKRWSGHLTSQRRDRDEVFEPLKRGDPSCSQPLCRQARASPGFGLTLSVHQQTVQSVGTGKFRHDQHLLSQTRVERRGFAQEDSSLLLNQGLGRAVKLPVTCLTASVTHIGLVLVPGALLLLTGGHPAL